MLRCMPLEDPPPNRFASDTDGATARAEATTMAAAKNRFFIANAFVEGVFVTGCIWEQSIPLQVARPKLDI
jgi:hypothetical protein